MIEKIQIAYIKYGKGINQGVTIQKLIESIDKGEIFQRRRFNLEYVQFRNSVLGDLVWLDPFSLHNARRYYYSSKLNKELLERYPGVVYLDNDKHPGPLVDRVIMSTLEHVCFSTEEEKYCDDYTLPDYELDKIHLETLMKILPVTQDRILKAWEGRNTAVEVKKSERWDKWKSSQHTRTPEDKDEDLRRDVERIKECMRRAKMERERV